MSRSALGVSLVACLALVTPRALAAQGADVIRGRVISASIDSAPIFGVQVTATSISGNVSRSAKTNTDGRFQIVFPNGDGDYWVTFAAIGFTPRRYEVKRLTDESILIADARLTPSNLTMDTIRVAAGNRRRPDRNGNDRDVSGTDRSINTSIVPPDQAGDLAAMAATLPGVTFIPGTNGDPSGFSVLGLSTDQNLTSLNGLASSASDLPRDAGISVSLSTSPYDVSQGGFSGGALNIRTLSGSNYFYRSLSFQGNAPQFEWTDPRGRSLGQQYTMLSPGGRISGPLAYDKAFYSVSAQLGRQSNDLFTLLNTDSLGLQTAGVSPDSVTRLLNILQADSVPTTTPAIPSSRLSDRGNALMSFDFAPPSSASGQALNLTVNGSWNRLAPLFSQTTQYPSATMSYTNWNGSGRLRHTTYLGSLLSETAFAWSGSKNNVTPYVSLPTGSVLVHSDFSGGTSGVQSLQFGGMSTNQVRTSSSLDLANQLSWFSEDNKHRIKFTSEIRRDGWSLDLANNLLGTFTYNSLADVQSGTPASFSRQLGSVQTNGAEMIASASLGDSYRPTTDLQIVYGARMDANWYLDHPEANPAVQGAFGLANEHVPNGIYVSPRIGFSWTYGSADQISAFSGAARVPRGVIQGGVGMFQNVPSASLTNIAMASTGLPSGIQQITCVGSAAPTPDWKAYLSDQATIPTACANGSSGVFVNTAPNVTLFAPDYAAQRRISANLQWTRAWLDNRIMATIGGTYAVNLNQTGFSDVNFRDTARFTLPDEGNRPVFVNPSSIVPTTGAVAFKDSRIAAQFNRVTEQQSNLESVTRQASISIRPLSLNSAFSWSLAYTLNSARDQVSGFSSTAGSPVGLDEARSSSDYRHQFQFTFGLNLFNAFRIDWTQRIQSGTPYTPVVASDINGDGYANDRAYVADPATTTNPALASGMASLLNAADASVQSCLRPQLGQIAARNSCEGPWTTTSYVQFQFNPVVVPLPQRATLRLFLTNPIGAADLLVHGENNLHGWGQTPTPDPRLLIVHGFDAATQRYNYEVNQRFGSTAQSVSVVRNPVALTLWFAFDLGPTRERQQLTQTLDRGRSTEGTRMSEQFLKAIYGSGGIINPLAQILAQADTLKLTGPQADSIATMNRWYVIHLDSLWAPVAHFYATLPDNYDQGDAYARYRQAREASVDLLITLAPSIRGLLTQAQLRKLPDLLNAYLDHRYLTAIRSSTSGTPGGVFAPSGGGGFGSPMFFGR